MKTYDGFNRIGDTIPPMGVPWIIPGWLAAEETHILAGAAKTGKSQLAVTLAARITTGGQWFDGFECPKGRVAYYSTEEDVQKVILPRFLVAGGDPKLIHFGVAELDAAKKLDDVYRSLTEQQFDDMAPLRLVVIDGAATAVNNVNDNSEVRDFLTQHAKPFASRTRAGLLLISHTAKGAEGKYVKAQDFVLGAQAWVAVPRMSWVMVRDKTKEKKAAVLVRFGNLPHPMDGAVRIYGSEFVKHSIDKRGLEVVASKITKTEMLTGDPDDLFMAAAGIEKPKAAADSAEEESLSNKLVELIKRVGAKTNGYVKQSEILFAGLGTDRKVKDALAKMQKAGTVRYQFGLADSTAHTKWWGLATAPVPLGHGLDTADWSDEDDNDAA